MASTPETRRAFAVRLAFELVVVFVGVYAAFALSELQELRETEERRRQVEQALLTEVRDITTNTRRAAVGMAEAIAAFDSASAAGRPLPLTPFMEALRVESHMWQATLASGGLQLLDVATIYRLSGFYNELNAGFEQLAQLRSLSETMLVPNLDRGIEEFYDAAGRLRPQYGWYMQGLRNVERLARSITSIGDSIVAEFGGEA